MRRSSRILLYVGGSILFLLVVAFVCIGIHANSPKYQAWLFVKSRACVWSPSTMDRIIIRVGYRWRNPMPWEIGGPALVPYICDIMEHDPDPDMRQKAVYGLTWYHDRRACEPLLAVLKSCDDSTGGNVRWNAMYALGNTGDPRAFEALGNLLDSYDGKQREEAASALSEVGDDQALHMLLDRLIHSKADDVRWAEVALGDMRNDRVVPSLFQLLRHQDERVRERAISALVVRVLENTPFAQGRYDFPESAPERLEFSKAASEAVLSCSRGETPEHLKTLTTSQDARVREAADMALKRLDEIRRQVSQTRPATRPGP